MALTDIKVRTAKPTDKQYKLTDGNGMHLLVHPNGSRYWRLQYRFGGKQKMFIRSSELRFARWSEIDFETSMWTIPAER
jgi:integrase